MKTPIGIRIVALIFGAYSLGVLAAIIWAVTHPDQVHSWAPSASQLTNLLNNIYLRLPLNMLIGGILCAGLWKKIEWARMAALASLLYAFVRLGIMNMPSHEPTTWLDGYAYVRNVEMFIIAAIFIYLLLPGVQRAFASSGSDDPETWSIPKPPRS